MKEGSVTIPTKILIVSLGASPSIVTETLWALARRRPPFWPDKLVIVTTALSGGVSALIQEDGTGGWRAGPKLEELCASVALPQMGCELVVASSAEGVVEDIRAEADAIAFGDTIAHVVQRETADPNSIVHLSIAGGRKTMSYHAGAAMTLFGRASDELSHVLISPSDLEQCEDFWWPTPEPSRVRHRFKKAPDGSAYMVSAYEQDVTVTLVSTPFFRARDYLPENVIERGLSYADAVRHANAVHDAKVLSINLANATASLGDIQLDLSPVELALYGYFAQRRINNLPRIPTSVLADLTSQERKEFEDFRSIVPNHSKGMRGKTNSAASSLGPSLSRLREKLEDQIRDARLFERFGVSKGEGVEKTSYGISANSDLIRLQTE